MNEIEDTIKMYKRLSSVINTEVRDYLSSCLKEKDGKVVFDQSSIDKINKLSKNLEKRETIKKTVDNIRFYILGTINKLLTNVSKSFIRIDTEAIKKGSKVMSALENHAVKNIDALTDLNEIYDGIRKKALGIMSSIQGASLEELREQLSKDIAGKDIIGKHWNRWTYDIYSQYQRAGGNELRKELGLTFAIFEGDLIATSREWCEEHAGNVYYIDEINEWTNESWAGKNETNYNPIIDLGGYGCRHQLRWISNEMARRLRPDVITHFPNEFI